MSPVFCLIENEIMKSQKILNHSDHSSEVFPELMSAVNDPNCQFKTWDLLDDFKKNLEMLRDNYLQMTQAEFNFEVREEFEQTKQGLIPVDPILVDWVSRDPLLNHLEANFKP
jgi:hypothetical protein